MENLVPKMGAKQMCDLIKLCSVRIINGIYMVGLKDSDGNTSQIKLDEVIQADTYQGLPIFRTYSSGHIFFDESKKQIYLISTQKKGKVQHQFTGGSPDEPEYMNIFSTHDGILKINLDKVEDNAITRTQNRTGAAVVDRFNPLPLVDWVMMPKTDTQGNKYWSLILLMHYIVKTYDGTLGANIGIEDVIGGGWFQIDQLPNISNIAPNAIIVCNKALEYINQKNL